MANKTPKNNYNPINHFRKEWGISETPMLDFEITGNISVLLQQIKARKKLAEYDALKKELKFIEEKQDAILKLIKEAEEVEIEEMNGDGSGMNLGGGMGEAGLSGSVGKDKNSSYYIKYKFKRGGKTEEHTETNMNDQSENT